MMKNILFLASINGVLLVSCNVSKVNKAYTSNLYSGKADNLNLLNSSKLITYKQKYIFELMTKLVSNDTIMLGSGIIKSSAGYKDDGVSLFTLNDSNYFSIDTFAFNATILKFDHLSKKKNGLSIPSTSEISINNFGYAYPKDTTINNSKLYYIDTIVNGPDSMGHVILSFYFTKSRNFKSYQNIKNTTFPGFKFEYIGFSQKIVKTNDIGLVLLENIVSLTKQQRKICESLLQKAERYNGIETH